MPEDEPKKVFISYSWKPAGHKDKTLKLAQALRSDRVDCMIDQGVFPHPPQGWINWTRQQVEQADFVLVVISPDYKQAAEAEESENGSGSIEEPADRPGKGVAWEARYIRKEIYNNPDKNKRIIPITFESGNRKYIPWGIGSDYNFYELLGDVYDRYQSKPYEALLRHIYHKPYVLLGELGKTTPDLRPIDSRIAAQPEQKPQSATQPSHLGSFKFEVVTVGAQGQVIARQDKQAQY